MRCNCTKSTGWVGRSLAQEPRIWRTSGIQERTAEAGSAALCPEEAERFQQMITLLGEAAQQRVWLLSLPKELCRISSGINWPPPTSELGFFKRAQPTPPTAETKSTRAAPLLPMSKTPAPER